MRRGVVSVLVVLLMSGCYKAGPNFDCPCAPYQGEWRVQESELLETTTQYPGQWWRTFNDPVLNELMLVAYDQNLSLRTACYRILEARAQLGITFGQIFPQVQDAVGSATRFRLSEVQPNIGPFPDIYFSDYLLGFQVGWELDFWGKYRRAIEADRAGLCSAVANYEDVLILILADTASTYVTIRTLEEQLKILERNIQIQERSLQIAQAQFDGGFVSELDVQQAKTLLTSTQSRYPELERQHQQAQNALAVLLGVPPDRIYCYLNSEGDIPKEEDKLFVSMPESILYSRPDVKRALYESAAQSALIGVAFADYFPQISLLGSIGTRTGDSDVNPLMKNGEFFSRESLTFSYGAGFVWPILNYGRITNNVRKQQARFCQAVTIYQETVLRAYREVEDGMIAYLKGHEQLEYLQESTQAANRSVELANRQYVEGLVDYTRVLNTQESLLDTEEVEALTRGSLALSVIATYKALGGGWSMHGCCEVVEEDEFCEEEPFILFAERPLPSGGGCKAKN